MTQRVDVFPAIIYLAEPGSLEDYRMLEFAGPKPVRTRKVDRSRVAIYRNQLHVVVDSPEGPQIIFREPVQEVSVDSDRTYHAITASGKIAVFGKDQNCGCGSRLRSWNPYNGIVGSSADPTE